MEPKYTEIIEACGERLAEKESRIFWLERKIEELEKALAEQKKEDCRDV